MCTSHKFLYDWMCSIEQVELESVNSTSHSRPSRHPGASAVNNGAGSSFRNGASALLWTNQVIVLKPFSVSCNVCLTVRSALYVYVYVYDTYVFCYWYVVDMRHLYLTNVRLAEIRVIFIHWVIISMCIGLWCKLLGGVILRTASFVAKGVRCLTKATGGSWYSVSYRVLRESFKTHRYWNFYLDKGNKWRLLRLNALFVERAAVCYIYACKKVDLHRGQKLLEILYMASFCGSSLLLSASYASSL